jgi:hypothetical protein
MLSGRMSRCRASIGSSQTAWPFRWFEIAHTLRSYFSRMSSRLCRYSSSVAARFTSRWSPQQAISSPS